MIYAAARTEAHFWSISSTTSKVLGRGTRLHCGLTLLIIIITKLYILNNNNNNNI